MDDVMHACVLCICMERYRNNIQFHTAFFTHTHTHLIPTPTP